jgi:cobalt-zinc-cadmium efflux system membrane fusion protein
MEFLMNTKSFAIGLLLVCIASLLTLAGCSKAHGDTVAEEPPPGGVVSDVNLSLFEVDHPEQFPVAIATVLATTPELVVTGTIGPDVTRTVPVISLASGRVVAIRARLGDTVKQGQVLLSVRSDDIAGAFATYKKAMADEVLSHTQLVRAQDLYSHGAIALNDLQVAEDTETKAKVDVETGAEHLRHLGSDLDHPTGIVDIVAPVSGVITDQQVTNAAGVQSLGTNPFTISDLSYVWIVCDVYENDLANVRIGDSAEIRLNAYPNQVFRGKISNIGATLDPQIRTAKVRIEVQNPGIMRLGMFVKATFHSQNKEAHTALPATAILHLHDRDWVYLAAVDKKFRRAEVITGDNLPDNMQEIRSGLLPGQQVVANALILEHAIAQ